MGSATGHLIIPSGYPGHTNRSPESGGVSTHVIRGAVIDARLLCEAIKDGHLPEDDRGRTADTGGGGGEGTRGEVTRRRSPRTSPVTGQQSPSDNHRDSGDWTTVTERQTPVLGDQRRCLDRLPAQRDRAMTGTGQPERRTKPGHCARAAVPGSSSGSGSDSDSGASGPQLR